MGYLSWAPGVSPIQGVSLPPGVSPLGGVSFTGVFLPETLDYSNEVLGQGGGQLSQARLRLVDSTIRALIGAGLWTRTDRLWPLAASDSVAGRVSLKNPGSNLVTLENGGGADPSFTVDRGFTFDGVQNYLNLRYNPTGDAAAFAGNSGMIGYYERTEVSANTVYGMGGIDNAVDQGYRINPRTTTNAAQGQANSANSTVAGATSSLRATSILRTSAGVFEVVKEGVSLGTFVPGTSGTALPNENFLLGCFNNNGVPAGFRAGQAAMAWVTNGDFSVGDHLNFKNAINLYLAGVGAQV